MTFAQIVFLVMAVFALVFAGLTVTVRNIVHSIVCLICCLLFIAGIYISFHADFLAAAQVAIYVGAIAILILFATMFTHDPMGEKLSHLNRQSILGVFVALALFGSIVYFFIGTNTFDNRQTKDSPMMAIKPISFTELRANQEKGETSVIMIGDVLYGEKGKQAGYAIPVEMASFMLLAAIIGGIEMAKKKEDEV